jgi:hypothetical protein
VPALAADTLAPEPTKWHFAVQKTRAAFRGGTLDHKYGTLRPKPDHPCIWMAVTRASLDRSLLILNRLAVLLEANGFVFELPAKQNEAIRLIYTRTGTPLAFHIQKLLLREVKCPLPDTRALFQVSRDIGVDARTLRLRLPNLCREISARHISYKKSERARQNQILRDQMIAAIKGLNRAAIPANRHNTALALKQPDLFRRRNARATFNQLAKESLEQNP